MKKTLILPIPQTHSFNEIVDFIRISSYTNLALITDQIVFRYYGNVFLDAISSGTKLPLLSIVLESGEQTKNLTSTTQCWEQMLENGCDRKTLIVALGGGAITDLAGFVAACYMRGIDFVNIPTTLMGMVDAAIGGKTAINLGAGKNIIGAFYHPKKIFFYPYFLKNLPEKEFVSGIAEVIKYGLIQSPFLFQFLEDHHEAILSKDFYILEQMIQQCFEIKSKIVELDEKDLKQRVFLNLGHTFAHAIESLTAYNKYLHGEAVSIGINYSLYLSHLMGLIDSPLLKKIQNLFIKFKLPITIGPFLHPEEIVKHMFKDKKTEGKKLNLVLLKDLYCAFLAKDVSPELVINAIKKAEKS